VVYCVTISNVEHPDVGLVENAHVDERTVFHVVELGVWYCSSTDMDVSARLAEAPQPTLISN
jgi:hypothetical protein